MVREAPGGASQGGLVFYADVAARRAGSSTMLDVLLEVPYTSLRFIREGAGWTARFDVTVLVYDRGGNQVNGDLWTIPITSNDANREQTTGRSVRRHFPLVVTEGRLKVDITIGQTGSGREGKWSRTIEVPRWEGSDLSISRPLFGRCDSTGVPVELAFVPRDTTWRDGFTPVVRRRYGDSQPILCVQGEIYDQSRLTDPAYRLEWSLKGGNDRNGGSGSIEVPRVDHRGTWLLSPPIDSLDHGPWRLKLTARLTEGSWSVEENFEIDESRLNVMADSEMIRGVLSYIAGNDELVELENTTPEGLGAYWDAFWLRRDPSPGTPRNENVEQA